MFCTINLKKKRGGEGENHVSAWHSWTDEQLLMHELSVLVRSGAELWRPISGQRLGRRGL